MAMRCGFYVKDGMIHQRNVDIEWNKGFSKSAKREYIEDIKTALGDVGLCADVTTASPIEEAKMLSPMFVKCIGENVTVEDYWQKTAKPKFGNAVVSQKGVFDWIYLSSLSEDNIEVVLRYNCFIDVFHNPSKDGYHNTQARSLAVLKLLVETDYLSVIENLGEFLKWYQSISIIEE